MADNNNVAGEIIALTYAYDTHHTQQRYWRLGEFLPFRLDDANFRGIAKRGTRKGARDACLMLLVDGLVDAYLRETCRTAADQVQFVQSRAGVSPSKEQFWEQSLGL
jgi:hypothetical protein